VLELFKIGRMSVRDTLDWPSTLACACQGNAGAQDALLRHYANRLNALTSKMLCGFPGVRRWADTDDVLQNSLIRLLNALRDVRPATPREFLGLATLQIRRELIDLARHFYGPQGEGANHQSHDGDSQHAFAQSPADPASEPDSLVQWREFHEQIDTLPADEREVVSLLFYQGLGQSEAAELLSVSVRTVQRRWHAALEKLHRIWNE
jgi:RNA polymerase sigma-70 factor (ECF subfamily)